MNAESIGVIGVAVVLLTQLIKFMNLIPDRYGPIAVLGWAALGVFLYGFSNDPDFGTRHAAWVYFTAWLTTAATAAGIFGFSRAAADVVAKATAPPSGAGAESISLPSSQDEEDEAAAEAILLHAKQLRKEFPDALKKESRP